MTGKESVERNRARIKHLRNINKLTQESISELLGIARNSYSNFERGLRNLSITNIERLSDILGENVESKLARKEVQRRMREEKHTKE